MVIVFVLSITCGRRQPWHDVSGELGVQGDGRRTSESCCHRNGSAIAVGKGVALEETRAKKKEMDVISNSNYCFAGDDAER